MTVRPRRCAMELHRPRGSGSAVATRRKNMGKPTNLRAAAGLAILLLAGCLTNGGPVRDANAQTMPLHEAAWSGDAAAIRALLAGGADVNAQDETGFTPLHIAALSGDVTAIRVLLAGGADVNARDKDGTAPLHVAVMRKLFLAMLEADAKGGRDKLLSSIFPEVMVDTMGKADQEVFVAFLKGDDDDRADTVRALLAGGAAVNARDDSRVTPLYIAALSGDAAAVEALLDAGGDPNAVAFGCGPMDIARLRMENTETSIAPFRDSIEALRAAGARPRKGCRFF